MKRKQNVQVIVINSGDLKDHKRYVLWNQFYFHYILRWWLFRDCVSSPAVFSLFSLPIRNPSLPHLTCLLASHLFFFFFLWNGYFKLYCFPLSNQLLSSAFCFQAFPVIPEMPLFDFFTLSTYCSHFVFFSVLNIQSVYSFLVISLTLSLGSP